MGSSHISDNDKWYTFVSVPCQIWSSCSATVSSWRTSCFHNLLFQVTLWAFVFGWLTAGLLITKTEITHWPGFSSTRPFSFSQHTVNSLLDCSNKPARKCQHTECAWKQIKIWVFYIINKLYLFILANDSYFSFYWTAHPTHHFSDIKPVKQAMMCHAARTAPPPSQHTDPQCSFATACYK